MIFAKNGLTLLVSIALLGAWTPAWAQNAGFVYVANLKLPQHLGVHH